MGNILLNMTEEIDYSDHETMPPYSEAGSKLRGLIQYKTLSRPAIIFLNKPQCIFVPTHPIDPDTQIAAQ